MVNNQTKNEAYAKNDSIASREIYSLDGFHVYLTKRKYSDNTKNAYVYSVQRVAAEWEDINIKTLAEKIDEIRPKYDKGGIFQDKGQIGNATVINALRRFTEYVNYIKSN